MNKNEPYHPKKEILGEGARLLITIGMAIIILFGMKFGRDIIMPIVMAGFLAIISYSITYLLSRYLRFPHWLSVTSTVLIDCGVVFGIISLINFLAIDFVDRLKSPELAESFAIRYNEIMDFLATYHLDEQARSLFKSPQELFDTQQIITLTQTLTGQVLSFISVSALVLILMTFFLGEAPLFRRNIDKIVDKGKSDENTKSREKGKNQLLKALVGIQRYLFIKTLSSIATGLFAYLLCLAVGIEFAFLWGVLACALNFIPTFGSIVAAIPPILLAMFLGSWGDCFAIAAGYLAINFVIGNGIEPLFLGKQFGIATTVVLLSVLLWGWVLGPMGMLLAVPISVLIKLALENSRDLQWVSTLVSDDSEDKENLLTKISTKQ